MRFYRTLLVSLFLAGPVTAQPADDFAAKVRPFVTKYCAGCHGPKKPSAGLDLTAYADAAAACKDHDTWTTVRQRLELKEMPPKGKPQPADDEVAAVMRWISDAPMMTGPPSPGRVTLRRLNRDEYNRTVRDLVGVRFRPADDFPSDDVGNGFDNIGDVLSMPPILLEKYLAAAERVVQLAFEGEPYPPTVRKVSARDLEATGKADLATRGESARILDHDGAVFVTHTVPHDGELVIRARIFGKPSGREAGTEPVRAAFRVDDRDIRVQSVRFPTPSGVEVKAKVTAGQHRIAIVLLNPSEEKIAPEKRRSLGVAGIEIEDPPTPSGTPATYTRIMIGDSKDESPARARKILAEFARRAYRRPVTDTEVARLVKLFETARASEPFDKAVAVALQAVLVSPHFLFRVETDRAADRPDGSYTLTDYELSSRLSYFLWSSMPDEELFRLAGEGKLRDPAVLKAQTKRMLADPKASALVENFADQWLNLRILQTVQPARRDYVNFDDVLRQAMRREAELFFEAVLKEDRSIRDFLDADYTFVNERLARHYGISGVEGDQFRKVALTDRNRGGVLTMAGVLTITSNPTRTSPVKRGKWVLENLLGAPPPPPPPGAGDLSEEKDAVLSGSLRQRMEQHRAKPECATCHARMDPLGFGLENFDGIGSWRTKDGRFAIDPAGELPDGSRFAGPAELKQVLIKKEDAFRRCLTEKMLTYALGRGLGPTDRPWVDAIAAAVAKDQNKLSSMVLEIVTSDPFRRRSVKR